MNIQIFGSSKSFDTKKAERWFKERRIKYQYIDVPSKGLSPREYQSVKQKVGFAALVNTKCRAYEDLYMAYIAPDAQEEKLLEHPELFLLGVGGDIGHIQVLVSPAFRVHQGLEANFLLDGLVLPGG